MTDLLIVLTLLGAAIVMFAINKPRMDAVGLIMLVALPFIGILTMGEALTGFSDPNIVLIAALFVAIGLVMGKLRPNWFVGIRTPWTLSSKLAWTRSHSLGGWLFTALGIAALAMLAVDREAALVVLVVGGSALAITVVAYSYIVWRSDPNRVPPAGTSPSEDA